MARAAEMLRHLERWFRREVGARWPAALGSQNTVIEIYPNTGQFWKWTPEQYLVMSAYADMKGKWTK